jgi:NADH-quinone oxidoreductase subunit J
MKIMIVLLIMMALAALWSVMTSLFLRATIALALTSVILTVIMFRLGAPLAAVFELSVCAGLISVIFISVISLTQNLPIKEQLARRQSRITRFRYLPLILLAVAAGLYFVRVPLNLNLPWPETVNDVRTVMWELRRFDLFGQILVLLAGTFGVIILFKGSSKDER